MPTKEATFRPSLRLSVYRRKVENHSFTRHVAGGSMFEKYTEKARIAIFHARDETSKFGTLRIESEQLLLGLLAADKSIFGRYLGGRASATEIREAIVQATEVRPP